MINNKNLNAMNKKEQLFEVILPPTDMLEKELEDVLGGIMPSCGVFHCDNYGSGGYSTYCKGFSCEQFGCPPGYIWKGCDCVPIPPYD